MEKFVVDITAAGHLLAHETIYDGIRDISEKLGIDVSYDEKPVSLLKSGTGLHYFTDIPNTKTQLCTKMTE